MYVKFQGHKKYGYFDTLRISSKQESETISKCLELLNIYAGIGTFMPLLQTPLYGDYLNNLVMKRKGYNLFASSLQLIFKLPT